MGTNKANLGNLGQPGTIISARTPRLPAWRTGLGVGYFSEPSAFQSLAVAFVGARRWRELAGVRLSPSRARPRHASDSRLAQRPALARSMQPHGLAVQRPPGAYCASRARVVAGHWVRLARQIG